MQTRFMRRIVPLVAATTVFAVLAALAPHPVAAQAAGSLAGLTCESNSDVYYIRAPEPGGQACAGSLAGTSLSLKPKGTLAAVPAATLTAKSDDKGNYQFANVAQGDYALTASRTGFATVTVNVTVTGATVRDVALDGAQVKVSGRLLDSAGKGVSGYVSSCCEGEVKSAADGAFALTVRAGTRGFNLRAAGFENLYDTRFVDGSAPISFTLKRLPPQTATISGTARDQDGNPVAGIEVHVNSYGPTIMTADSATASGSAPPSQSAPAPSSGGSDPSQGTKMSYPYYGGGNFTTTDAVGRYSIHVDAGQIQLSVQKEGFASFNKQLEVAENAKITQDVKLLKYPAKTAHLVGTVVDAETGKPVEHLYVSVRSPAYGLYECSQGSNTVMATDSKGGETMGTPARYDGNGCALQIDGNHFDGKVTPGYTIFDVSYNAYEACPEGNCADYYAWTGVMDLPANADTQLTVKLVPRAGAAAIVQGYILDHATGKAVPGAQIWFNNQDRYGYGSAKTDKDGSYRIALREGYHSVSVSAPDHLSWQGVLDVAGKTTDFDIEITPGQDAGGGCCYYPMAEGAMAKTDSQGATPASSPALQGAQGSTGKASSYQDLGGSLGPYDANRRSNSDGTSRAAGAASILLVVTLLGVAARKRE